MIYNPDLYRAISDVLAEFADDVRYDYANASVSCDDDPDYDTYTDKIYKLLEEFYQ